MDQPSPQSVTEWLGRARNGDRAAVDLLLPAMYDQLRAMARKFLQGERPGHTLGATALVHEAFLRLAGAGIQSGDRLQFMSLAAGVMRHILVDHARANLRQKRGGGAEKISLGGAESLLLQNPVPIMDLDEALTRLGSFDARKSRIVELIYFGGLTYDETAAALEVSPVTIHRELKLAKAWLWKELSPA